MSIREQIIEDDVFVYDELAHPSCLRWNKSIGKKIKAGDVAGYVGKYVEVRYKKKLFRAHRIIWFLHYKFWPVHIDHIDGNKLNNKIENLRDCKRGQLENQQNNSKRANNRSGYLGVSWSKSNKKWQAQITVNYEHRHLGFFSTPELAYETYKIAKQQFHKFNPVPRES